MTQVNQTDVNYFQPKPDSS